MTGFAQKHRPTLFPPAIQKVIIIIIIIRACFSLSSCAILRAVVVYCTDDNMFPALWSFARSSMLGGTVHSCPRLSFDVPTVKLCWFYTLPGGIIKVFAFITV